MLRGITIGSIQNLGYSFDEETGNLISRRDNRRNLTEIFSYDNLGRLREVSGPSPLSMDFANNGNITSKTSVGDYSYGTKPPAVTGVTNPDGQISSNDQRHTYTTFNKVDSIIQSNYKYDLQYGHQDQCTVSMLMNCSGVVYAITIIILMNIVFIYVKSFHITRENSHGLYKIILGIVIVCLFATNTILFQNRNRVKKIMNRYKGES
jgi:hypothetical protein